MGIIPGSFGLMKANVQVSHEAFPRYGDALARYPLQDLQAYSRLPSRPGQRGAHRALPAHAPRGARRRPGPRELTLATPALRPAAPGLRQCPNTGISRPRAIVWKPTLNPATAGVISES